MPPTAFLFRKRNPQNAKWGEWDYLLVEAVQQLENERCRCGLPVYICLAGETEVITKGGTKPIRELLGPQTLLTKSDSGRGAARWVEAEVKSFGIQRLMCIELSRGLEKKQIFATPEHRWFTQAKVKMVNGVRDWSAVKEVVTHSLRPGDTLVRAYTQRASMVTLSPVGVLAGFMFGDGTIDGDQGRIDLFGAKDEALLPYFSAEQRSLTLALGDKYADDSKVSYYGFPKSWKRTPDLDEGSVFLRSWLAGYFAADGTVSPAGTATLACADAATLEKVRDIATICGIGSYGVRTYARKGMHGVVSNISYVSFARESLSPEFFIIDEHRARFEEAATKRRREQPTPWTVVSVSETDRVEEVFCAVVPGTHSFVLKDNILTGNCHSDDPHIRFRVEEDVCEATKAVDIFEDRAQKSDKDYKRPHGTALRPVPYTTDESDFVRYRDDYYRADHERRQEVLESLRVS